MSGHSKWSTIKHQKGVTDQKRGAAFTKLANAITIAVKNNKNASTLIEKAKEANMPKDKIQRAIDKGAGKLGGAELSEAIFEGFGPENVAIVIEAITDNSTRTSQEIKNIFSKLQGAIGTTSYLFTRCGEIELTKEEGIIEKIMDTAAEDFEESPESVTVYTKPEDFHKVKAQLEERGLKTISAKLVFKPNKETLVTVSDPEKVQKITTFLEAIDDLDDVQNVYTNAVL